MNEQKKKLELAKNIKSAANGGAKKEFTKAELQNFKLQIEQFKKALGEKMKDPTLAKKAAEILSEWMQNDVSKEIAKNDQKANKKKAA